MMVLLYVDDFVVGYKSQEDIERLVKYLEPKFKLRNVGAPRYFLGIEIARSQSRLVLSHRKYVLDQLEQYGMLGSRTSPTLMKINIQFRSQTQDESIDATL